MKNALPHTQLRLITWYIGVCFLCFSSVDSSCSCRNNDNIDHIPPTPSLEFSKLSYDRSNRRLVVIIKNTGKETAKGLSLRCTNISQDESSRAAVRFNNTLTTATIPLAELSAGSSIQGIYVAIDFQTAKEALVQIEVIDGEQQVITTNTIPINRYSIDLLSIGAVISIAKPGETGEFKWKLVSDEQVDFTDISLKVDKIKGADIDVSVEGTPIGLTKSIDEAAITGADLEKLAKQNGILVKVKNNTTGLKIIGCALLDNGKEIAKIINILASDIESALLPAVGLGDVKLLKQAIAGGADVNSRNTKNVPALHLATQDGYQEIVQILLKNGADVNAKDNDGNTALHAAAGKGNQAIAKLLLEYRARKDVKNKKGETAVDLAKEQDMKDLINNWKS